MTLCGALRTTSAKANVLNEAKTTGRLSGLEGKSLGLLLSSAPGSIGFRRGLELATRANARGVRVYLYCIDEGVRGITQPDLLSLADEGVQLFACAHAAGRFGIPASEVAVFSGLGALSDLMANTDRFIAFN